MASSSDYHSDSSAPSSQVASAANKLKVQNAIQRFYSEELFYGTGAAEAAPLAMKRAKESVLATAASSVGSGSGGMSPGGSSVGGSFIGGGGFVGGNGGMGGGYGTDTSNVNAGANAGGSVIAAQNANNPGGIKNFMEGGASASSYVPPGTYLFAGPPRPTVELEKICSMELGEGETVDERSAQAAVAVFSDFSAGSRVFIKGTGSGSGVTGTSTSSSSSSSSKPLSETFDLEKLDLFYSRIAAVDAKRNSDVSMSDGKDGGDGNSEPLMRQILINITNVCLAAVKEQPVPIFPEKEEEEGGSGSGMGGMGGATSGMGGAASSSSAYPPISNGGHQANGGSTSSTAKNQKNSNTTNAGRRLPPLQTPQGLRFVLFLLFHPDLQDPDNYTEMNRAFRIFRVLDPGQKAILSEFFKGLPVERFRELVGILQQYVTLIFVEAQASDLGEITDRIPEHIFNFFVSKISQLCKNGLAALDILWKANLLRAKQLKEFKKLEMRKGTLALSAMQTSDGKNVDIKPPELPLDPAEFINDALNQLEIIAKTEYYTVIWQQYDEE